MNALLAQFIPEARDLLEQAGTGMLALERDAGSQSVINDVFRAVHTLKGSSGLFDVAPLTRLMHAAEDLLDQVRTGELALTSDIVDRLLDSLDLVGRWIDALETREELPSDAEGSMAGLLAGLRARLNQKAPVDSETAQAPAQAVSTEPPAWLAEMAETDRVKAFTVSSGETLFAWSFVPDENCFFRGEDPVAMVCQTPGLLTFRIKPRAAWPDFGTMDPLSCVLCFEVLSESSRDALDHHIRYVPECVEIAEIEPRHLVIPAGASPGRPLGGDLIALARRQAGNGDRDALEQSLALMLSMVEADSYRASALRWCEAHLYRHGLDKPDDLERLLACAESGEGAGAAHGQHASLAPRDQTTEEAAHRALAHKIALEQMKVLATPAEPAITAGRLDAVGVVLKNLGKAIGDGDISGPVDAAFAVFQTVGDMAPLLTIAEALRTGDGMLATAVPAAVAIPAVIKAPPVAIAEPAAEPEARATEPAADNKNISRVLRVDQSKIDAIMNLVAELIVAKNGLSYLATRAEQVHGSRIMAREIKDQFAVIDRITQGLQVGVMSVRMMPVSQVFQRFPRLVRDIARKLGKKIELVIEGEDTEADKNVLESLADPLIHMVRNSLDHGIEMPEDRRAAGKPELGTLRITARQENDFVVIEVRDDGKGIDPRRVKAKALQLGLITQDKADQMSDEEAANLVFAPGFSTKEEVSDLSGRGVGMDVVRTAVLKAGGDVSLRSTLGTGTSVIVRLPLTMAVTRIVTIECKKRIFGIPMDLVVETVKIKRTDIRRIKDRETFVLRDTIIPIVRLARALNILETDDAPSEEEAVMVVRVGRDRVGMVVDGFRERLEVIVKPLEGILEGMTFFSGTALLGDGQVLLILDLQEIL